ncbi:hypothetical protein PybrP1_000481 [[Pythium] brassicae (nom. inval.)]|nr:hypothetical protein PybrP1_000481 [[Pythium] brassicae (nom. inval.)]
MRAAEITTLTHLQLARETASPAPAAERMPIDAQAFAADQSASGDGQVSGATASSGSASGRNAGDVAVHSSSVEGGVITLSSSPPSGSLAGTNTTIAAGSTNTTTSTTTRLGQNATLTGNTSTTIASNNSTNLAINSTSLATNSTNVGTNSTGVAVIVAPAAVTSTAEPRTSSSSNSGSDSGSTVELAGVNDTDTLSAEFAVHDAPQAIASSSTKPLKRSTAAPATSPVVDDADDDDDGDELPEELATQMPQMHGVPSNPTLVAAVAHDGRAEVTWKAPDDDGADPITEYEVSWFDEEDGALAGTQVVTQIASSIAPVTKKKPSTASDSASASGGVSAGIGAASRHLPPTTAVVSHLLNGKSYTFKVRAKNVNGFSVWSAKSLAVSPLHPPDLCGRISCSGRGTCFPNYQQQQQQRRLGPVAAAVDDADASAAYVDAQCICRPGYNPPDCSVKSETAQQQHVWKVSEWSGCSSGCGGGKRSRAATCVAVATDKPAASEALCADAKPSLTGICNGMECGSKLVSVKYEVEMSYDEVLFSAEAIDAFELAFTTEVSAALQIPRSRLEVTALKRGSIAVFFNILPASRVGEQSLNDIVERLQDELGNATSTLRSKGTFARRVEQPNGVKMSFSLADQRVQGGAEDISVLGLIGTVLVLCFFVFGFGWSLRTRHQRILKQEQLAGEKSDDAERVFKAPQSELKRMGIRTMA